MCNNYCEHTDRAALIRVAECADEVVWHAGDLLEGSTIGEDARQAIDNLTDALFGVGGEA